MILAFPWDPSFDVTTTRNMAALVWVDLLTLNPVFEGSERGLLGKVGEVVYITPKNSQSKYSNLQGVVKVDLTQPLQPYVVASVERIRDYKIDIDY